jgi:hypothetical protein
MVDAAGNSASDSPLDATLETDLESNPGSASSPRPKVEVIAGMGPRMGAETAALLRSRLRIAALVLLMATLFFNIRAFVSNDDLYPTPHLSLPTGCWYSWSWPSPSRCFGPEPD